MKFFWINLFCCLCVFSHASAESPFVALNSYEKAFEKGRNLFNSNNKDGFKSCSSSNKASEGFCFEGFFYEQIKQKLNQELSRGMQEAPSSPAISEPEKIKVAWSKALGQLMAEFNQTFLTQESLTPKLFLHDVQGDKYRKFYVDGWTFYKSGFSNFNQTLTDCQKYFFQKHVCLWSLGRSSYYRKTSLRKVKRPEKELIAGFLFAKAYFSESPLPQKHSAIKIALYSKGKDIGENQSKLQSCMIKNHPVECLSTLKL